jgi:hypothetical protein
MPARETYPVEIAGLKRDLRLFEVAPGLRIAILNILGDTELVQACAKELSKKLKSVDYDVLVTAEAKSIPGVCTYPLKPKNPMSFPAQDLQTIHGRRPQSRDPVDYHRSAADFDPG